MTLPTLTNKTVSPSPNRTLWQDAKRSFSKNRLAIIGLVVVGIFIVMAVFANILAPFSYYHSDLAANLQFPSLAHPFGTDPIGRDELSLIIFGARTSLLVGFSVQLIAFGIGLPLGAPAMPGSCARPTAPAASCSEAPGSTGRSARTSPSTCRACRSTGT